MVEYKKIFIPGRFSPLHSGHQQMIQAASQHAKLVKVLITHGSEITDRTPVPIDRRVKTMQKTIEVLKLENIELATCLSFDPKQSYQYMQQALNEYDITKDFAILSANPKVQNVMSDLGYTTITLSDISSQTPIDICATQIRNMVRTSQDMQQYLYKHLSEGAKHYRPSMDIKGCIINYTEKTRYYTGEGSLITRIPLDK